MQSTRDRTAYLETRAAESARVRGGVRATVQLRQDVTMTGATRAPAPKTKPYRDPALLEMARGRPCLLCRVLWGGTQCSCHRDSTVACHSNWAIHGKSKGRKADDCYSVWGGDRAHRWLDQGADSAATKMRVFMATHALQVLEWRQVAQDPSEPERFRRAARRALEHLNASPSPQACP